MLSRAIPLPAPRRPGFSHSIVTTSRAIERQVFTLRTRAVLVKAQDPCHTATPITIGKAIEANRHIPSHSLRVTCYYPEALYIHFDAPSHRDRAIDLGCLTVDGATFLLLPWSEATHGIIQTHSLHVRLCIEKMPLHLRSMEGAELVLGKDIIIDKLDSRTHAQEATDIFSCWVWCWSLDCIPNDYGFTVFPKSAGRVEEMHGYSPPRCQVAPPPEGIQFSALIHIDLIQ